MKRTELKRTGGLKRTGQLKRKTRLNPVNRERRARRRAEQFSHQAARCRTMDCCACGRPGPSDPAHVRSRGAGGRDKGNIVPLCRPCHNLQHAKGMKTFEAGLKGVSLLAVAWSIAAQLEAEGVTWE